MLHRSFSDYTVAAIPNIPPGECSCWILKKGCQAAQYCFSAKGNADLVEQMSDQAIIDVYIARFESSSKYMDGMNQAARQLIQLSHRKELCSNAFQLSIIAIAALTGLFAPGLLCSAVLTAINNVPTFWAIFDVRLFVGLSIILLLLFSSSVAMLCMIFSTKGRLSHLSADLSRQWIQHEAQGKQLSAIPSEKKERQS